MLALYAFFLMETKSITEANSKNSTSRKLDAVVYAFNPSIQEAANESL